MSGNKKELKTCYLCKKVTSDYDKYYDSKNIICKSCLEEIKKEQEQERAWYSKEPKCHTCESLHKYLLQSEMKICADCKNITKKYSITFENGYVFCDSCLEKVNLRMEIEDLKEEIRRHDEYFYGHPSQR